VFPDSALNLFKKPQPADLKPDRVIRSSYVTCYRHINLMIFKHPLAARFDNLPLILCGPVVRRVEPEIVSVWVALKESRFIELELYPGYCSVSAPDFSEKEPAFKSEKTGVLTLGKHLFIGLVSIDTRGLLNPGAIFSYNMKFYTGVDDSTHKEDLQSLKLLDEPEILGYIKDQLPSFITAPEKLTDLRIAHGSCRKPHGPGQDALAVLDGIMKPDFSEPDHIQNPSIRPHYFFHTGDQIYADDCSPFLIEHYNDTGNFLLGKIELLPFPVDPEHDYTRQVDKDENFCWIEATAVAFPPNRRATNFYSGFTGAQSNHLYSIAEFCAAYLFQWCDVLWPPELPATKDVFKRKITDHPATREYLFPLVTVTKAEKDETPDVPDKWLTLDPDDRTIALTPDPLDLVLKKAMEEFIKKYQSTEEEKGPKHRERVEDFKKGLKAVRRVLANVPGIMSFDDHDVTDDWYLNGGWSKQALGTRLGETIIRNGLLAFAVFQAWGNDPAGWAEKTAGKDARSKLLEEIPKWTATFKPLLNDDNMVNSGMPPGYKNFIQKFHTMLGFANFEDPPVKWHSFLKIGPARVFVLDTRTRRDFSKGLDFPPNLIGKKALAEQIPGDPLPFGTELCIVISGAPALGLGTIESIGQPIIPRVLDVININKKPIDTAKRKARHTGNESLDVEHWSLHVEGYEAFLKRCASLKKVLFLSGDVHYGITSEMDYWVKDAPVAARFVQMVSSSLKNLKPEGQMLGLLPAALTQVALTGGLNREFTDLTSIGWEKEEDIKKLKLRVQTEPGKFEDARPGHFPLRIAYALGKKPVLLPLRDWPLKEYEPANPEEKPRILPRVVFKKDIPLPSFRWKMNVLQDERTDSVRFKALSTVFPDLLTDLKTGEFSGDDYKQGLESIIKRQAFFSRTHINRFVNWYSHVGIVHFIKEDNSMYALHSMFFKPRLPEPDQEKTGTFESPFIQYKVSLDNKPVADQPGFPLEGDLPA
jgi:hypothetical protein